MSQQLSNAQEECRDLQTKLGQLSSINEIFGEKNKKLRKEIGGQGRRRHRTDNVESGRPTKRRAIHSSEDEESDEEELDEAARVRLKFAFKFTFPNFIQNSI